MVANNKSKKELNTLEQEILIQEQLMVANEINKLEHSIAIGNSALLNTTRRIRVTAILFSSILIAAITIFIFIIFLIKKEINLSQEFQNIMIYFDISMIMVLPFISILSIVLSNKIIIAKREVSFKADIVMLRRLEKYYRFIKFDFNPEKYKIWNDDFVVDVDENGNLVKYVRFYNNDGTISTRPFKSIDELKKYLEQSEDTIRLKEINDRMLNEVREIGLNEESKAKFNQFNYLSNAIFSNAIVEMENVDNIVFSDPTIDYWPEQYKDKVSKWYSKEDFINSYHFINKLKSNLLQGSSANGNKVVVNTDWILKEFTKAESAFRSNFFKNYDITKTKSEADDIESYILMIKNLDMKKDPSINWDYVIDPKDINKEKLVTYNQRIKELEEKALELSLQEQEQERLLKKGSKNAIIKVQVIDADDAYANIFKNYNPYEGIEKEIKAQAERNKIIDKTKGLIIENDLVDFNFDDLSVKELKQIVKDKERESEELQNIREREASEDLIKLKNEIARVKASKFVEKHLAFEKYQNEEFRWMYHDGEGNYFEADDNMEWNSAENPRIQFNERKLAKIKELQEQYNELQKQKEREFNDKYSSIVKVKEKVLLEEQDREKKELEKINRKKLEEEKKEQKLSQKKEREKAEKKKIKQQAKEQKQISKNKQDDDYVENHPPNESWLGDDNRYYYHDGNGNYFTTNENNEWIPTERPNQNTNNTNITQQTTQTQTEYKANEPYQDANGTWWYFDEQGNYYYGDQTGQWQQYKGEQ